jgi:hypothetical protein
MKIRIGKAGAALAVASVAAAFTGACMVNNPAQTAQASQVARGQCFYASQVSGFHAIDSDTVRVDVGPNRMFELQIAGTCQEINWSQRVGIRPMGGGNFVCGGLDAELVVPTSMGTQRCPVTSVRQLSPEEVQAAKRR